MGLLSWLFPSSQDRIRAARDLLARGQANEARLEVLDLDEPEAVALRTEAERALALLNLDAALAYGRAGDDHRVDLHLQMAEGFDPGGLEERFRATRRELREIRAARSEQEIREQREKEAKQRAVDPLGITGGASWLVEPPSDAPWDPEREEIEARLALIVEGWPADLHGGLSSLGAEFAKAVLDLEDGRADRALQALLGLPDDQALVRWERARCAHALGDPRAAARELKAFAELAGGHRDMGRQHSGELLALVLAESGALPEGLRVLRNVRATAPKVGEMLYAQLLHAAGELAEAEQVLVGLIRAHPATQPLYAMLARVRLAGGHRVEAMRALEASTEAVCCTPGKCGSQPPSLDVLRMLATLYLEDGLETERAAELADQAFALVQQPAWEDVYLRALLARARGEPEAAAMATRLRDLTPPGDPRAQLLVAHLG